MPLSAVANVRHIRAAVSAAAVCALVFAAIAPFAAIPLTPITAFIPIYQSAITVNDGLTAALLLAHAYYSRSRPLLILASGYAYTTLITAVHTLTFPGLFTASGLLGAGDQSTAWLYMFWHAGFPLFVIAYAYDRNLAVSRRAIGAAVLGVAAMVGALTVLATALHDTLPRIMAANHYAPAYAAVIAAVWTCSGVALYAVWKKRTHSVLDVWLMLVLWVWIIEVALSAVINSGRFDLGFYAGRTFGLIASSILLYVVLFEYSASFFRMQAAYAQLAESQAREAALKVVHEAHAQTRYRLENTPLAVIEWDGDFIIKAWNARAEELFGWRAAEVTGKRIDAISIIHPDDVPLVSETMRKLSDPANTHVFSANRNLTKSGAVLHCEWYNSVLHREDGGIVTVFSLVLDNTQRTLAEQQLRDADHRKDIYLATLAHELRNPIAPIRNIGEILRLKAAGDVSLQWAAHVLERQTHQMARLLDDLLDVARIAQGKIALRTEVLNLIDAVQDAVDTCKPMIEARGLKLTVSVPAEPLWVMGDSIRLAQVFGNLLNNAAKYTDSGGSIEVRAQSDRGRALVTVTDTGVGIAPEMLDKLFEPFSQATATLHRAQGGLGIGLALAKGLIDLHGGNISVTSAGVGRGSEFAVRIPLTMPDERAVSIMQAAPGSAAGRRILVVDDNRDAADTLTAILSEAGAAVDVAYDGSSAIERAKAFGPDVIILDIGLPGMSGYDVAREIAAMPSKPMLIAVTGWGQDADRRRAVESGFDLHMTKPVDPRRLLAVIGPTGARRLHSDMPKAGT